MDEADIPLRNCSRCNVEIVRQSIWDELTYEQRKSRCRSAGLLNGRPVCEYCENPRRPRYSSGRRVRDDGEASNGQETAIRRMEDGLG